jgi:CNT family concentrative nucleoside transporter
MSNNRKNLNWRLILGGLGLQLFFALFILKTPIGQPFFGAVDVVVKKLLLLPHN